MAHLPFLLPSFGFLCINLSWYESTGWNHRQVNIYHIKTLIDEFNCEDVLNNQVFILNKTITNIVKNFIPN